MKPIFTIDSTSNKLSWTKLDNGSYRAYITLGVANLPLEYVDSKGVKHVETITEDELFNEDSLKSAYGLPLTIFHPKNGIFDNNAEQNLVGATLESFLRQDSALLMPATIIDKRAIALIDSIIQDGNDSYTEISPGYFAYKELNADTNVLEQKQRRYDHAAILPVGHGRGGQKIVLRLDSNTVISTNFSTSNEIVTQDNEYFTETTETENTIMTVRKVTYQSKDYQIDAIDKDGKFFLSESQVDSILKDAAITTDSYKTNLKEVNQKLEETNGKVAALQITVDSKSDMITIDEASKIIGESIELWQIVEPIFKTDSKDFKPDYSLTPVQIKELYLKKFHPTVQCDSAAYIQGAWSVIEPTLANKVKSTASDKVKAQLDSLVNTTTENLNNDSAEEDPVEAANKRVIERMTNAHK